MKQFDEKIERFCWINCLSLAWWRGVIRNQGEHWRECKRLDWLITLKLISTSQHV